MEKFQQQMAAVIQTTEKGTGSMSYDYVSVVSKDILILSLSHRNN